MSMIAEISRPNITEITVEAVHEIGETAASKIEAAAEAHERKARADADKMRQLAAVIRDQCKTASEHVAAFCDRSTDVMGTIGELSSRVAPKPKAIVNAHDDGKPIPAFLQEPQTKLPELAAR